jgi:hypothetical protein
MSFRIVAFAALSALILPLGASADPRPFTFGYDTYAVGKGNAEFEQWVTWNNHKEDERGYNLYEIREEVEFGLADNFDIAFYVPNWNYEDSKERTGTHFDSVGVEGILYLSNPVTDPVGLGIYTEIRVGEGSAALENKLLVQKDVGNWIFLYNFVVETEVEGIFNHHEEENEVEGALEHTFGVSYALPKGVFIGAEAIVASEYEDWSDYAGTTVYAGPVVSFQNLGNFWVTFTPTFQITDQEQEPDFQFRMIAGYQF